MRRVCVLRFYVIEADAFFRPTVPATLAATLAGKCHARGRSRNDSAVIATMFTFENVGMSDLPFFDPLKDSLTPATASVTLITQTRFLKAYGEATRGQRRLRLSSLVLGAPTYVHSPPEPGPWLQRALGKTNHDCVGLFRKPSAIFCDPLDLCPPTYQCPFGCRSYAPSTGSAKGRLDAIARSSVGRNCHATPGAPLR